MASIKERRNKEGKLIITPYHYKIGDSDIVTGVI